MHHKYNRSTRHIPEITLEFGVMPSEGGKGNMRRSQRPAFPSTHDAHICSRAYFSLPPVPCQHRCEKAAQSPTSSFAGACRESICNEYFCILVYNYSGKNLGNYLLNYRRHEFHVQPWPLGHHQFLRTTSWYRYCMLPAIKTNYRYVRMMEQ